jgi:tetratricopeptide (TPR) repeat protein
MKVKKRLECRGAIMLACKVLFFLWSCSCKESFRGGSNLRIALLVFVIVFVCTFKVALAGQEQQREYVPATEESIPTALGFADVLFSEQDYYRAVTEYKRFIYLHPEHPHTGRAYLNIARAAIAVERWEDALAALEKVLDRDIHEPLRAQAHLLRAEVAYLQEDFSFGYSYLGQLKNLHPEPALEQRVRELQLWSLLEDGELEQARMFAQTRELELYPDAEDIRALQDLPRKSPRLAGTLSALLPGAGQLYNGRYREAGMAFALNAAFLAGGIQAINTGNTVLGGILLFFEAGWYGGNIYNAVNTAHKSNRTRYRNALDRLRDKYQFSLLSTERGAMLQLQKRF